ncbi:VCBS repeat-containing protein [bacterium]|nr:VCBS repeat-containing protein [bacterium]
MRDTQTTLRTPSGHRSTARPPGPGDAVRVRLEELEGRDVPAVIGAPDPSYSQTGVYALTDSPFNDVAVQPDGRIVFAGAFPNAARGLDFYVNRQTPDGISDLTFGAGGQIVDFAGGDDVAEAILVQPDGKILVAGRARVGAGDDFAVARFNPGFAPDGVLDAGFGSGGKATFDFGGAAEAVLDLALGAGGAIYLAGPTGVVGLTPAGTPLPGFGVGGFVASPFGAGAVMAVAVRPDGRLVVAGDTGGPNSDFAVALMEPATGALDPQFGTGGVATVDFGGTADGAIEVAVQADGAVIAVGQMGAAGAPDPALVRLTAAGVPDPAFGTGGRITFVISGTSDAFRAVTIQPDGRIVVVGDNGHNPLLQRFLPADGTQDPSFSGGSAPAVTGRDVVQAVAIAPGGRIVLAGASAAPEVGFVERRIGSVEEGRRLAVAGPTGGTARVYTPDAAGGYSPTPANVPAAAGFAAGAVRAAVGDVNGDNTPDTVLVTGPGVPLRVAVVSGADNSTLLVAPFDPFGGDFIGGGFVAAADIDNDGRAELIVTPDRGGGPRVSVFSLGADGSPVARANFFGIDDPNFRGGARAAAGDVDGDGRQDLVVTAGFLGGPRVAVFAGTTLLLDTPARLVPDFFAFPGSDAVTLRNGAFVAAGDVTGDGMADLVFGGGPGGAPRVFILSGARVSAGDVGGAQAAPVANFFVAGDAADRGGVRVATTDADGDQWAEVVVGSGEGRPGRVRVYLGQSLVGVQEPPPAQTLAPYGDTLLADGVYVG